MNQEKSKKVGQPGNGETVEAMVSSLKDEVRRGLNLLDQCVNSIAQAKWILISVDSSVDQLQTKCPTCNDKIQVIKKALNSDNADMMNARTEPSVTVVSRPGPKSSKETRTGDSGKEKEKEKGSPAMNVPHQIKITKVSPAMNAPHQITITKVSPAMNVPHQIKITKVSPAVNVPRQITLTKVSPAVNVPHQIQITIKKEKEETVNAVMKTKPGDPTARRTGGAPRSSMSKPDVNKLSKLEVMLKKAKLTQVSLQCMAAIMQGKKAIRVHEIPKRDPKFKIDVRDLLDPENNKPSSAFLEKSSSKQGGSSSSLHKFSKSTSHHGHETSAKSKGLKIEKSSRTPNESKNEQRGSGLKPHIDKHSHTSRRETFDILKEKKRRHSSSSSSSSRSCSTCSSSTVERKPISSSVAQKSIAAKKPKISVDSDEEDKKSGHKIKVSKGTFSVIKSKAALKHHETPKGTDKLKPKASIEHNGKLDAREESTAKKTDLKFEQKSKSNNSNQPESKSKLKQTEDVEQKSKSKPERSEEPQKAKDPFDKLKLNLGTGDGEKQKTFKETSGKRDSFDSSDVKSTKSASVISDTSEKSNRSNAASSIKSNVVTPDVELKIQNLRSHLRTLAGGKAELKQIKQKQPIVTEALEAGITSMDSPEFRELIIQMFEKHRVKIAQEAKAKKAAQKLAQEKLIKEQATPTSNNNNVDKTDCTSDITESASPQCTKQADYEANNQVNEDDKIPDEDTDLNNEARRLGITSTKSDEYKKLQAEHYTRFKNRKADHMKELKSAAQKLFTTGSPSSNLNSDDKNAEEMFDTSAGDDESIELGEDVIGSCLNVITATAALQAEITEPTSAAVAEADRVSTDAEKEIKGSPEAVHTPILTLQDTVSPTAVEKFFRNDETAE